jgi:hypothetical protein
MHHHQYLTEFTSFNLYCWESAHPHRAIWHPRSTDSAMAQWWNVVIHTKLKTEIFMKDKCEVVTLTAVMRSGFGNGQGSC